MKIFNYDAYTDTFFSSQVTTLEALERNEKPGECKTLMTQLKQPQTITLAEEIELVGEISEKEPQTAFGEY